MRETKDIHWLNSTSSPEALSVERRGNTCLSISKKERISLKHSQSAWEDAVINLELRDTGNITLSIFHKSTAFLTLRPHVSCWQDMSHFFLNLLCVCWFWTEACSAAPRVADNALLCVGFDLLHLHYAFSEGIFGESGQPPATLPGLRRSHHPTLPDPCPLSPEQAPTRPLVCPPWVRAFSAWGGL